MPQSLKIGVSPNSVYVEIDENVEPFEVMELLTFDEEQLEELLQTHAATQAYWEALAVRLKKRCETFDDELSKRWWAHNRLYARFAVKGLGHKEPTISAIDDMVILLYSEHTTKHNREKYGTFSYTAFQEKKDLLMSEKEFKDDMYAWILQDPPWYFEGITRSERQLKEDYEIVKIFAEKLNARAFHLKEYLTLTQAKKNNIEPKSYYESSVPGLGQRRS